MKIIRNNFQSIISERLSEHSKYSKVRSYEMILEALEDPEWKPHLSDEERDALQKKTIAHHENHWEKKGAAWAPGYSEWENAPPWPFSTNAQEADDLNDDDIAMFQEIKNSFEPGIEEYQGQITPQHLKFADELGLGGERLKIELEKIENELTAKYPEAESSVVDYIDDFHDKVEMALLKMKRSEGRKILGFYAKSLERADKEEKESLQEKKRIIKMTKQQLREIILEEIEKFKGKR